MEIKIQVIEEMADRLVFIQQETDQDIPEILKLAIDLYYNQLQKTLNRSLQILEEPSSIDCCSVENDLSTTYESVLLKSIQPKI
jgi:hypothetical protein